MKGSVLHLFDLRDPARDVPWTDRGMSHALVRRRIQVSPSCSLRHFVPVALPHFSHVRILIRFPRKLVVLVVLVVESEHGKSTTHRKAASKHDQEDDEPRRDREAHIVPLCEAHRALLLNIHSSQSEV
jgi:hypothetical protein